MLRAGAPVGKHQYQVFHFDKTISIYVTTGVSRPVFKHQQQVGVSNMLIAADIRTHLWTRIIVDGVAAVVGPSAVDLIWFVATDQRIHQRGAAVVAVDPAAVDGGVVA